MLLPSAHGPRLLAMGFVPVALRKPDAAPRATKPAILAASDRPSSLMMLVSAWLLVALIPLIGGRAVALALDEPLLGIVAAMLALIPLLIALIPRR